MIDRPDSEPTPLDDAARAGWLYYVAGLTQDQIARELGTSRQRAQRLVSRAISERLIHVRLEHRVSACLDLEAALIRRFGLKLARVAPSLGAEVDPLPSIAPTAAAEIERVLRSEKPTVVAFGTGRSLRATVEEMTSMVCEHHKIVSLNGNISADGSASYYDVIFRIADRIRAPHYPMPMPVIAQTAEERELFHSLKPVQSVLRLARNAGVTFVGVGQMGEDAPLLKDGFITEAELREMQDLGAVGEVAGWVYDSAGRYLETSINQRVAGVRVNVADDRAVIAIAGGRRKLAALAAGLKGNLFNGLITDELTARALLA
ncbi:sugar-binding transcriptional regulator [Cereibacter sphaeroides]|uniref:sugar-binding transcriptional regulator n=1 Tax=Rhodobacterales TaxID=204455 RepID=UPI000BBE35B4|nr:MULTISPECIES: sugar-binding transcriptional regulator [Paracoccaceae]MCE6953021.1 sugar-binding transcriptional regulator [Cereibacter sphaeroides]MCE6961880.1 sugar-binding transcriptional regulator [Cereibacter sphaeroides]MCE6975749.1 sugar-binding transcriptional regulator [Cereibacter sphaeroides]